MYVRLIRTSGFSLCEIDTMELNGSENKKNYALESTCDQYYIKTSGWNNTSRGFGLQDKRAWISTSALRW